MSVTLKPLYFSAANRERFRRGLPVIRQDSTFTSNNLPEVEPISEVIVHTVTRTRSSAQEAA